MKFYEKPMANIEKIDVQDVITVSLASAADMEAMGMISADADQETIQSTIVFEW